MEYTDKLGLRMPAPIEKYNVADFNHNAKTIDDSLGAAGGIATLGNDGLVVPEQLPETKNISTIVWTETSNSASTRTVNIDGVTSWDDVLRMPLYIQAGASGTLATTTLNINGLGAKPIYFPSGDGDGSTNTPLVHGWVRTGQAYCVVWDGTSLRLLNPQMRDASVDYKGIVRLVDSVESDSITDAATPNSVKTVKEAANTAKENATYYGTCATAASTVAKVVVCSGFALTVGVRIAVKFTYANTALSPTINVNGTGAYTLTRLSNWETGATVIFTWNGSTWLMTESVGQKSFYGTCATAAATAAKGVVCASFASGTLVVGARVSVHFTYANTASSPTLNVNSTGAKYIYVDGALAEDGAWRAGQTIDFVYTGTYWYIVGSPGIWNYVPKKLIATITESGTFNIADYGLSIGNAIDAYIVGGGGGGGYGYSGGGGYCKLLKDYILSAASYDLVVGVGGAGATAPYNGADGGSSSAFGITVSGGGGGTLAGWSGSGGSGGGANGGVSGGYAAKVGGGSGGSGGGAGGNGGGTVRAGGGGGNIDYTPINPYDGIAYGCGGGGYGHAGGNGGGAGGRGGGGDTNGENGFLGGGGGGGYGGTETSVGTDGGNGGIGGGGGGAGGSGTTRGKGGNGGDGIIYIYAIHA